MTHIDQMEDLIEEITSYTVTQGKIYTVVGVYIQPSPIVNSLDYLEIEFYDVVVIESTLAALQAKKTALLKVKTNLDFDYNNFDARGYINVDVNPFVVTDTVTGGTSGATGTVTEINGLKVYLKDVTGTWQTAEVITDGGSKTQTTTSILTTIDFPFYLDSTLIDYKYPINYNTNVGGKFPAWIRLEARWTL